MERTKTIIYNLTPLALEYLQMRVGTSKAGDPKHLRVIEKLLKQEYWPMGYFTVVDWGEGSGGKPDIAVLKPCVREVKDKDGNELRMPDPYYWDYSSTVAVEVEMAPQKNREQVHEELPQERGGLRLDQVRRDLGHQRQAAAGDTQRGRKADPEKYRIDEIEFESLNDVEPAKSEEPASPQVQVLEPMGPAEEVRALPELKQARLGDSCRVGCNYPRRRQGGRAIFAFHLETFIPQPEPGIARPQIS